MKSIFLDSRRRLRNGWWVLVFLALFVASRFVYTPVARGLEALGVADAWTEPLRWCFVLLVTWICLRLRREPLSSVGLRLRRRWFAEAGVGTLLGAASVLLAAGLLWSAGGVRFELDPRRGVEAIAYGFYVFLFVSLFEETLFRGFVFQRLVDGAGVWFAQISLALLFAASHWGNPDMEGATMVVASIEIFLGALLLGLAWLRTGSLALPVGIHLGWNWVQGSVLGFGVSGFEQAGWWRPVLHGQPEWVTGGDFGLESSVFAIVADLVLIALLWRWRGTKPLRSRAAPEPVPSRDAAAPLPLERPA